jgi:hypothetical protein
MKDGIVAELSRHTDPGGRVRPGTYIPLLRLTSTNGSTTEVVLIEGEFRSDGIDPAETWTRQVSLPATLVNSVSEHGGDGWGGISTPIAQGCSLDPIDRRGLQRGDIAWERCHGAYQEQLGIGLVASAAIVVFNPVGDVTPCRWASPAINDNDDAFACLHATVDTALAKVLGDHEAASSPSTETLILPALGTGTGQLPRGRFYDLLGQRLVRNLSESSAKLPSRLLLHVWRGPRDSQVSAADWEATRYGVAEMVVRVAQEWVRTSQPARDRLLSLWAKVFGVSFTLAILVLLSLVDLRQPGFLANHLLLIRKSPVLTATGWALGAIGTATMIELLLELARFPTHWSSVFVGIGGTILYPLLDLAKNTVEQAHSVAPDNPRDGPEGA